MLQYIVPLLILTGARKREVLDAKWQDFDLLFGADKLQLKIVDIPIRYRDRTYGSTQISRFRHGFLLLGMLGFAARKLKFV